MDYVVFGIGFGATLLVLGLLIRDVGPRLRLRNPSDPDGVFHAEELVARVSWSRFCGALGTVWAIAGLVFVLITAVCMIMMMSDGTAGQIMIVSLVVLLVAMALWVWAFFDRFGSYGILPERDQVAEPPVVNTPPQAQHPNVVKKSSGEDDRIVARQTAIADQASAGDEPEASVDEPALVTVAKPDVDLPEQPGSDEAPSPPERLLTPEERLASAQTSVNHESVEAELDMPVRATRRQRQRSFRPTGSQEGARAESEAGSDDERDTTTGDETVDGPDSEDQAASPPASRITDKSASPED